MAKPCMSGSKRKSTGTTKIVAANGGRAYMQRHAVSVEDKQIGHCYIVTRECLFQDKRSSAVT